MTPSKTAIAEAGKEAIRLVLLSVIPVILAGINTKAGSISVDWGVVMAIGLVTLLRAIDRYLHIYNTESKPGLAGKSLGLVRTNW